jgi:hypothetical protein
LAEKVFDGGLLAGAPVAIGIDQLHFQSKRLLHHTKGQWNERS